MWFPWGTAHPCAALGKNFTGFPLSRLPAVAGGLGSGTDSDVAFLLPAVPGWSS